MVGSIQDIHDRKQAEKQIRTLTQKLIEAQESERQTISRELHDRVAQDLSTTKIACDLILGDEPKLAPEFIRKVSEISNTLNSTIFAVRDLAYDLRPPGLEDLGLAQTIFLYCEDFSEKSGVHVDFHYAGINNLSLGLYAEINIFRLIQEGLNNIWKHADASHAVIRLVGAFPNIILRIEDNGKGFDIQKRLSAAVDEKRMGLRSMEERASLLQGKMSLQSRPNEGTIISLKFPYKENKSD
jgi:signal transduction histidine kinase